MPVILFVCLITTTILVLVFIPESKNKTMLLTSLLDFAFLSLSAYLIKVSTVFEKLIQTYRDKQNP
ncbi:MAG: hypothetical protein RPR97_07160 [Colwellia sp.]